MLPTAAPSLLPSEKYQPPQASARERSKVDVYKWVLLDEEPDLTRILKTELKVPPEYQRDLKIEKVNEFARAWSWVACGALLVARRHGLEGPLFIVDGQHRWEAAMKRADVQQLPCLLFKSPGVEVEAQAFLRANTNRKPVGARDKFRAMVITEDPVALKVAECIKASGRRIANYSDGTTIACVAALTEATATMPTAMASCWPLIILASEGCGIEKIIVKGVCYLEHVLLRSQRSLNLPPLRERFLRLGHAGLLDGARKAAHFRGASGSKVWAEGMAQALNKGTRTAQIEWPTDNRSQEE